MIDKPITILLEPRDDGGLRVSSNDERGLILSGPDPEKVMECVLPALAALKKYRADHPRIDYSSAAGD